MFGGPLLQLLEVLGLQGLQPAMGSCVTRAFACQVRHLHPQRDSQATHPGDFNGGVQQQTLGLARNTIVASSRLCPQASRMQSGGDGFLAYLNA